MVERELTDFLLYETEIKYHLIGLNLMISNSIYNWSIGHRDQTKALEPKNKREVLMDAKAHNTMRITKFITTVVLMILFLSTSSM